MKWTVLLDLDECGTVTVDVWADAEGVHVESLTIGWEELDEAREELSTRIESVGTES